MSFAPATIEVLLRDRRRGAGLLHVERVPGRPARFAPWPGWADPRLRETFAVRGVTSLWSHQAAVAEAAWQGNSVALASGTASGKSLAYQLPVLSALLADPAARALYIAPTKALAADQFALLSCLQLPQLKVALYDGDTAPAERVWARRQARLVLTNPDMLSCSLLPAHNRWSGLFAGLRFVVIDESHTYRGIFGSHVAQALRRLRRICALHGSRPVFLLASATTADPGGSARLLTGLPVDTVTEDGSPRGPLTFVLYEPPLTELRGEGGAPVRRSALSETAEMLADLVAAGAQALAFARSRIGAEVIADAARRRLRDLNPLNDPAGGAAADLAADGACKVAAYRGGYLPEERRDLEAAFRAGALRGLAATNALELGIDICGLSAVILSGFPGTLASLWQQAGRAGRRGEEALAVLVARDDPLDAYLVRHPQSVFGRPVEAAVLDPDNPVVLAPHLKLAAGESPLTSDDLELFGPQARPVVAGLVRRGHLRAREGGWYWTRQRRLMADLRGTDAPVHIVELATGRLLGTVGAGSAAATVHPGAAYLHQGQTYVVEHLDLDDAVALVRAEQVEWTTTARDDTDIRIVATSAVTAGDGVRLGTGTVDVRHQVVGYARWQVMTGQYLGSFPLELPPQQLRTRAVWYDVDEDVLAEAAIASDAVPGATHAAEHAAIGLLPLFATCDRWDIGGVSTSWHPDTRAATVFVYDGNPGGAGFAARGFERGPEWLAATRDAVATCACVDGCPSCVQSPKCGNGNAPLDKLGAVRLLTTVAAALQRGKRCAGCAQV
ncbi:MAG: DEAD/DEAH box helicase [Frankiaceae bacterium]